MACHPDLVLRSKTSALKALDVNEGNVCRLCQDSVSWRGECGRAGRGHVLIAQAEDAIVSACKHVFDRECIRQYLEVQQLRGHRVSPRGESPRVSPRRDC
jgi:DNA repair protein RAD16